MNISKELSIPKIGVVDAAAIDNLPINNEEDKIIFVPETGEQYIDVDGIRHPIKDTTVGEDIYALIETLNNNNNLKKVCIAKNDTPTEMYIYRYNQNYYYFSELFKIFQLDPIKKTDSAIKTITSESHYMPVILKCDRQSEILLNMCITENSITTNYLVRIYIDKIDSTTYRVKCISNKSFPDYIHIYYHEFNNNTFGVVLKLEAANIDISVKSIEETNCISYFIDKICTENDITLLTSVCREVQIDVIENLPTVEEVVGPKVLKCGTKVITTTFSDGAWSPLSTELCTVPVKGSNVVEISKYIGDLYVSASARFVYGYADNHQATPDTAANVIIPVIISTSGITDGSVTFNAIIDLPTISAFTNEFTGLNINISYMIIEPQI